MRVAIAGAGVVGRSIAQALLDAGHKVLLIERERPNYRPRLVPDADWMLADACELDKLQAAGIEMCDAVLAATGDDKANLVFAFLAKTEFGVTRVVARVNDTNNQWMFNQMWGVDIAVSTPISLANAVTAGVTVGELVRLMVLQQGHGDIVAITLPQGAALVGMTADALPLPSGAALLTVVRGGVVLPRAPNTRLQVGDELLLAASPDVMPKVRALLRATHTAIGSRRELTR
jgi:trk system potassium uptake protein TrkA